MMRAIVTAYSDSGPMEARSLPPPRKNPDQHTDPDARAEAASDGLRFGCLTIKHFPAWAIALARHHDGTQPLIVQEESHIVALNRAAAQQGLERGMTAVRARSLCPEVACYLRDPVAEFSAWEAVLERMNRITPFMESHFNGGMGASSGARTGVAATLTASDQPQLFFAAVPEEVCMTVRALGASVGFAPHRSSAWLASIRAGAGQSLMVPENEVASFQDDFPVAWLEEAGFGLECVDGLQMLGCETLGAARAMNERHLGLAWGEEGTRIHRLLNPDDTAPVALFQPAPSIRKHFTLFTPCYDVPYVIPIVHRLVQKAHGKLTNNVVGQVRLVLHLEGHPPERSARLLTHPTARLDALVRFAERLTEDLFARLVEEKGRVGIEKVEVELAGLLTGDMIQISLFDRRLREVKEAVSKVHRRFPRALKRALVRDSAHFHEDRYSYVVWD